MLFIIRVVICEHVLMFGLFIMGRLAGGEMKEVLNKTLFERDDFHSVTTKSGFFPLYAA